ncbi:MAG: MBL fold metallo-hydrolase [Candidatus Omnitrophica bacterium]|nr:MBL fold metallo-hydrolase [Candidatus Omnitrophota bacterium]
MAIKVKNNVHWIGKVDWELRRFHGDELSTHHGSTYNSYLIKEEKTVLIDTVWAPFSQEFMRELPKEIALKKIDAVIINHAEVDHSGALYDLMRHIPGVPVYCTPNGVKSLQGHYHQDWNFHPVRTGDTLDIGNGKKLVFVEAAMLHWPDTMFTYLTGDNILFSNDAFGQHLATDRLFADLVDPAILQEEEIKYFANILAPWSRQIDAKLKELMQLNLPIEMICTSHGACWRKDIDQVIAKYAAWANAYQENRVTIAYDSMWGGTRAMAEAIARGIRLADNTVEIAVHSLAKSDKNDVMTDIFRSKALLLGSPSHNKCVLASVGATLEELRGLAFKGKKAAAFGCYGWSGEAQVRLTALLKEVGFEVVDEGIKGLWAPDGSALDACVEYGKAFAKKIGKGGA